MCVSCAPRSIGSFLSSCYLGRAETDRERDKSLRPARPCAWGPPWSSRGPHSSESQTKKPPARVYYQRAWTSPPSPPTLFPIPGTWSTTATFSSLRHTQLNQPKRVSGPAPCPLAAPRKAKPQLRRLGSAIHNCLSSALAPKLFLHLSPTLPAFQLNGSPSILTRLDSTFLLLTCSLSSPLLGIATSRPHTPALDSAREREG